jgi:uncharacterized protein involved in exopolysaccharide biosynthesis
MNELAMYPRNPLGGPRTSRDKLEQVIAFVRRALRYWWLVAAIVVVGAALSVVFAMTRKPVYESSAALFYHERIMTSLLQGREAVTASRHIGERYRELLLARTVLQKVVAKYELMPEVVAEEGIEAAVEELRTQIKFQLRGANTFRISYRDTDQNMAKNVTAMLSQLVREEDTRIRREQASVTRDFLEKLRNEAATEVKAAGSAVAEFLAAHPEFAQDAAEGVSEGASVRLAAQKKPVAARSGEPGSAKLSALERQRDRIKASLASPDEAPPPRPRERTAAQIAADAKVDEAQREFDEAKRNLEVMKGRFTDKHPDVQNAKEQVQTAGQRFRNAQAAAAALAPDDEIVPVTNPTDRAQLQRDLGKLESEIVAERNRLRQRATAANTPEAGSAAGSGSGSAISPEDAATNWVVQLETQWQQLQLDRESHRDKLNSLQGRLDEAQVLADSQMADEGASLIEVDPAFRPAKPIGQGKKLIVMAGVMLFGALGVALALGLAIVDDRIYRRNDLDALEVAPVLGVIPRLAKAGKLAKAKGRGPKNP